ncbi:sel1 repeat family protein [Rubrivivax rivuli]|uniref:Sel1 repeat family protein n=1 Tax=Rubrivivax rivuli TaxID=1862385 RepID=A0A437RRH8_9BURK|nr:sel1 repeat family protein [Rubrivivax rivuli]RVU49404.1 sel1 repeat family protein [Rubrivivax rivuli]
MDTPVGWFIYTPLVVLSLLATATFRLLAMLPLLLLVYMPIGLALPHAEFWMGQQRHYGGFLARDPEAAEFWYLRAAKPGLFAWETGHVAARRELGLLYLDDENGPLPSKAPLPMSRDEEQLYWGSSPSARGLMWLNFAAKADDAEAVREMEKRLPHSRDDEPDSAASAPAASAASATKP